MSSCGRSGPVIRGRYEVVPGGGASTASGFAIAGHFEQPTSCNPDAGTPFPQRANPQHIA
jgi:hypothetical protein